MPILREFKQPVYVARTKKIVKETWVEYQCPVCGKIKTIGKSQHRRVNPESFCSAKCRKVSSAASPNTNWWEDAYNLVFNERSNLGGLDSKGGGFDSSDIVSRDKQYSKYSVVIESISRV